MPVPRVIFGIFWKNPGNWPDFWFKNWPLFMVTHFPDFGTPPKVVKVVKVVAIFESRKKKIRPPKVVRV